MPPPRLMPMLMPTTDTITVLDTEAMLDMLDTTEATMEATMDIPDTDTVLARGLLMLMPPLMLMPMPTTPMVDSMVDTMVDSEPTALEPILMPMVPTPTLTDTTPSARGLLMLMPPPMLMLMPMPTTPMVDSMVDTMVDSEPTAMEPILIPMVPTPTPMELTITSARGLLMLIPLLMLMPTMPVTAMLLILTLTDMPVELMPTLPTPMVDTEPTASGNSAKPNQRLISNNQIKSIHEPALRGFE